MPKNPQPTLLDQNHIMQRAFDESEDRLRVDATVSASIGEVKITDGSIDATITQGGGHNALDVNIINELTVDIDQSSDSIRVGDGTNLVTSTNVAGKQGLDVNVINAASGDSVVVGTDDGQLSGTKYVFVNNVKQQILAAADVQESIVWADFGTKQERIIEIEYTSPTISAAIAKKVFSYSLIGTQYRLDTTDWSIV